MSDSSRNCRINRDTFDLFHLSIEKRLKPGRLTVADSTALYAFARTPLLEQESWDQIHELGEDVTGVQCVRPNGESHSCEPGARYEAISAVGGQWEASGRGAAHTLCV